MHGGDIAICAEKHPMAALSPDSELWLACSESRELMKKAYRKKALEVFAARADYRLWLETFIPGMTPEDAVRQTGHNALTVTNLRCRTFSRDQVRMDKFYLLQSLIDVAISMLQVQVQTLRTNLAEVHPSQALVDEIDRPVRITRSIHM